ncbi:MAG TPA: low temperature requirement protein A [Miltoncostaeaceae bacterium]|nr:low temperature requirement protein A [Miltoncostaeaceae bacterium]
MSSTAPSRPRRLGTVRREGSRVMPLELFFDLVFVLALTQCTALMSDEPTWTGLGKGLLILGVLWWAWVGYAWLTSVVEPEETLVRFTIFGAMAAMLVVALSIPQAFGDWALLFAVAYAVVRFAQIALFALASSEDPQLRHSLIIGLTWSTLVGAGLLVGAAFADGPLQGALWALALLIDLGGPFLFGVEGWRLEPGHFAERHGLIVIIALGESIVAIGVGAEFGLDAGIVTAAVIGIAIAAALWWLYFDIVALVAERRLSDAAPGAERNAIARDSFSYLHLPMIAGIVLLALGIKKVLGHVGDPLHAVPATALLGGTALYLLAHVAFRWRNVHRFSTQRLVCAAVLLALIAAAVEIPALVTLAIAAGVLAALIAYETVHFAELRERLRHQLAAGHEG